MKSSLHEDSVVTHGDVTIRVLNSFADAESCRSDWNALVVRIGADIYQTFDWCRLWWQHYGNGRQLHLVFCYREKDLVGVIPAFIETLRLGPARLRVARIVGSDFTLQLCNLIVMREELRLALANAIKYFFGVHRCDVLLLGPLAGPAAQIEEILTLDSYQSKLVENAESLGTSCNTYFHLPNTFEDYLKSIGKHQRGNFNRSVVQFRKNHNVSFDEVSCPAKLAEEFDSFCLQHSGQWQAEGKLGHFGSWPHARDFNRDLVRTLGPQGMVRFFRILADNKVVSSQYCFAFGTTNYWRLPARICGPEWDRLSFGRMGLIKMIEASLGQGLRTVEAGRGHYDYKLQLGGRALPLRMVQFVRRGSGVSRRIRFFKTFASLLDLAYYKVVYMRLAPRIPALRGALWSLWIKSSW